MKKKSFRSCTEDGFWSAVDIRGEDECWPWIAALHSDTGYGNYQGRGSHRRAYELARGGIPPALLVLHSCDNRPCNNPRHLFLGTHVDNGRDMVAKGRNRRGDTLGERNGRAKLTLALAEDIRSSRGRTAEMAAHFGVSKTTILDVRNGKRWL